MEVVVKNTGSRPLSGWTSSFSFEGDQRVANSWNAVVSQTGRQVTASNQGHNGNLAAGASTTWGAVVNGTGLPVSATSCTGR
jgi:cellulase/cellobiase CelA1